MGELALLKKFRAAAPGHPWVLVGPGQDCAWLSWGAGRGIAFKIDQVVEGTHFLLAGPEAAAPEEVGWKAMAKACSDLAAAGCWPVAATAAVNLRAGLDDTWAERLFGGLAACCREFRFALAGGDFSSGGSMLSVAVSLLGEGPASGMWQRAGARAGDELLVTGTLGGSRAKKHLAFRPRLEEARRLRELAGAGEGVRACIDLTDGLARDLGHLLEESGCGAEVEERLLPVSADARAAAGAGGPSALSRVLGDGEDFELLLAAGPAFARKALDAWSGEVPLCRIGRILPKAAGRMLVKADGSRVALPDFGYEHRTASDG